MNNTSFFHEFIKYSQIENTRMIYDFMTEIDNLIDEQKVQYVGIGGLKERSKSLKSITESIYTLINSCYDENGDLLHQNPLSNYIMFWERFFSEKIIDNIDVIVNTFNYYNQINDLYQAKPNFDNDNLPYVFEDVCFSICGMTYAKECYFLNKESNGSPSVISRSGYNCNSILNEDLSFITAESIKYKFVFVNGINCQTYNDMYYLTISLPLHLKNYNSDKEFMLMLAFDYNILDRIDKIASKILFLREKLFIVMERFFTILINYQIDFEYIKPLNDSVKILHISDLHINQNKKWDIKSKTIEKVLRTIEKYNNEVDFLAITGDVVHAASSAEEAQKHYLQAERIIQEIAEKLWKIEIMGEYYLPSDWKKRIIITTGNHDYAAMNDVVVETQSRVIKSATPSKDSGGTMSKFTYFLEFLVHFLNLPINNLISNDLNELRIYRNYDINILSLNTVSLTNSLQNNKVGLNSKKVDFLVNNCEKTNNKTIILSHHSPRYTINYLDDIYAPYQLFNTGEVTYANDLYNAFENLVNSIDLDKPKNLFGVSEAKELIKAFKKLNNDIDIYQRSGIPSENLKATVNTFYYPEGSREAIDKDFEKWISTFCTSGLYSDVKHFCSYQEGNIKNEFSFELYDKLSKIYSLCTEDNNNFVNEYKKIAKQIHPVLILSGHEHTTNDKHFNFDSGKSTKVYIVDKIEKEIELLSEENTGWNCERMKMY